VPTVSEQGIPGYDGGSWQGLLAPAKTPPAIVEKLNRSIDEFLQRPETKRQALLLGAETVGGTSAAFAKYLVSERKHWREMIEKTNITPPK